MKHLRILVLLLLFPLTLQGAITATYDPEPVLFFEQGTGPPPLPDRLVAKLGTLTFTLVGTNQLFDPSLLTINMSYQFYFNGPIVNEQSGYEVTDTLFHLYAVSKIKNSPLKAVKLDNSDGHHSLYDDKGGNLNTNPYIVHLYLVSELSHSKYILGNNYTLSSGTLEGFQVGVGSSGSGYQPGSPLVPVDGSTPNSPTPVLPPGSSGDDPIIYGDPSDIVSCTFSIINEQSFDLTSAYGNQSAVVATAHINVFNIAPSQTYGVTLTFTNATNTTPFLMKLQETLPSPPMIEYKLLFNNTLITPGDSAEWENLTNGTFTKNIEVTGISSTVGQTSLAGAYSDTVYVTITPIDSY